MVPSIVKDVFSTKFKSVNQDDTLSACLSLLKEESTPVLVVLNSKGKYVGVIAHRWIARSRYDPFTTKVKSLMRSAPTVSLQDSLSKVARLMITSGISQLPVFSGEKLAGIVTDEDVIQGAVIGNWGSTKVEEVMTKKPFFVEEDESVGAVLSLFREQGISHAPVVSDGSLVGIVSIQNIITSIFQPRQRQTVGDIVGEKVPVLSIPAKGIMTKPVITVLPETLLKDAVEKMQEFDISSLVVVRKGRPVGILTKRDLLEPLAEMEMPKQKVSVQFSVKGVEIGDIQRGVIMDDFESFASKYQKTLEAGALFVYMKTHGTNYKGQQLIHCRLQFRTRKGSFFSSSEGYGVEATFRTALDRLERQLLRSQELAHEPEYTKKYLRRIEFPSTEL
ncbi:MAG: CBS domain-containing protein [Candidatus Bathyarchaeota archaeon]|nr:CBS domain-containing protein [Candidatus Bathyarchaeota archaeon]